ncbi:MAG TPA: thioredoxin domain-containing protein, partial [Myxococcota bacterium]
MRTPPSSTGSPLSASHGLLLTALAVGLAGSAALLVDGARTSSALCAADGGCAVVKQTAFAHVLGIPTSAIGLAGFALLAVLALVHQRRSRAALALCACAGAAVALLLLGVQATIGHACPYCIAVDSSALVVAALAVARWRSPAFVASTPLSRALAAGVLVVAAIGPAAFAAFAPARVPAVIARAIDDTPKAQVSVVDFVDFECPFCRQTHAAFAPVLAAHKDALHIVRKQVPLTRIHPHALAAARAACCGELLGHGDDVADALMRAPVNELTEEGCARIAAGAGVTDAAYRACIADPAVDARIASDSADFENAGGRGLPTLYVGREKIEGRRDTRALDD